ncbi:unnamed protein product [Rotaria socialis]|uniref:Zinc finger MYM-type protein 1-like n=1 Tax=Rotaria socialis TaxID=392032 RepID=A0A821VI17_9BILA|nr:unnamed protein product [Rotaria socialis]CAF4907152.1 unnamed protein product [Rotaria socialis]
MKKNNNNNVQSPNKDIGTLESFWSKRQKTDQVSNETPTTLDTSITITTETQNISVLSSADQVQVVANCVASSCDLSISVAHPPMRPVLSSYPVNHENRSFQSQWYQNRPWLEYSTKNDSAHCYCCRHFGQLVQINRFQSDAFTTGFNSWRRALEKIVVLINTFRSSNRGNFIEILQWASSTDSLVNSILNDSNSNSTYLSPTIQNEILNILADQIRRKISGEIKNRPFVLMADESKDITGKEQMSVVLRYVDAENEIHEHFMGFIKLDQLDAKSLSEKLFEFLQKYEIPIENCIAQCYDGASVMSGSQAGVQTLMRQNYMPRGIYIHCFAHRLNLVIGDVCKVVSYIDEFMAILSKIHEYFTCSSVTNEYFRHAQRSLQLDTSSSLKLWAQTRWDSRWISIDALKNNYSAIITALSDLIDNGGHRAIDARGLLAATQEPLFLVSMFILHILLGPIKILSDQLKAISIDYASAKEFIRSIIDQIKFMRNETTFKCLINDVADFGKKHNINLDQPTRLRRRASIPTRFKDSVIFTTTIGQRDRGDQQSFKSNEDKFRQELFYSLIDSILLELNDRFGDENILLLASVSAVHPKNQKFLDTEELKPLASHLTIDINQLDNELNVVKHFIREKRTTMNTIKDLLTELAPVNDAFPATTSLLRGALCLPVSSTTCERSFSRMKLIKTYCRNSTGDERLSDLTVLAVERTFNIDLEETVDIFSTNHQNSRILLR